MAVWEMMWLSNLCIDVHDEPPPGDDANHILMMKETSPRGNLVNGLTGGVNQRVPAWAMGQDA